MVHCCVCPTGTKIKEGYFKKVRANKTPWGDGHTHSEDCDYVYPVYKWKWYCLYPKIKLIRVSQKKDWMLFNLDDPII